jgi:hypothetical protein
MRLVRGRRRRADRLRDLAERSGVRELAGGQRRAPRVEVRLARKVGVERLEPDRRLQQLGGRAPEARGRRDPRAQQIDAGLLELVERAGFGLGQDGQRRVESAGLQARLRRRQGAVGPPRRVPRQRDRALQERSRRRKPAARVGAAGRALELDGHVLVRPGRRRREVPDAAVRIDLRIRDVGEREVDGAALRGRGGAVDG